MWAFNSVEAPWLQQIMWPMLRMIWGGCKRRPLLQAVECAPDSHSWSCFMTPVLPACPWKAHLHYLAPRSTPPHIHARSFPLQEPPHPRSTPLPSTGFAVIVTASGIIQLKLMCKYAGVDYGNFRQMQCAFGVMWGFDKENNLRCLRS
jgi:hypothetical protein